MKKESLYFPVLIAGLSVALNVSGQLPAIKYLGTFNGLGTPDYLEAVDENVTTDFVDRIQAAVPENMPVPEYHPSYLNNNYNADIRLIEEADVFVSFVLEGAGYRNVLGFYTYLTGTPPQSVADIDTISIIFPNVSRLNSGGELLPGNRVNVGHFEAGTTIAFVVFANGWNGSTVTYGKWQHYSDKHLNPPTDTTLKQHAVVLYDNLTSRHVISFEDITRPGGDKDFNDAVFFGTTSPASAAFTQNVPGLPVVWEGEISSDWNNPYNWNPTVVPDSSNSVTITANAPNVPYLEENTEVMELVVEPGASITSQSEINLTVNGDYTSNSEVTTNLTFNGTGDQTIYGEGTINDLTVESGNQVIVNDPTAVEGNLILNSGDIITNNNLEIVSSSTANGMIMQEGGEIIGEVTFRRKIPNKTGYHYLSSPIKDATLADINDDFTLLSLGGDLSSSPFPNIYVYDETNPSTHNTDGWTVPTDLNHPMSPGAGFATYIAANTEIDFTGIPNDGDIDVPLSYTFSGELPEDHPHCPPDGWNLVGNPYPSALDWDQIEKPDLFHPGLYMWNPFVNKYATYINGVTTNGGSNRIAAFQGFFIRTDNENDTLKLRNSQRLLDSTYSTTFFRRKQQNVFKIAIAMGQDYDETAIYLSPEQIDGYNRQLDNFKMSATSQSSPVIYVEDNQYQYAIKSVNELLFNEQKIKLTYYAPKNGQFTLKQQQLDWDKYEGTPMIIDHQTGQIIDLSLNEYTFQSKQGTFRNRFEIMFGARTVGINEMDEQNVLVKFSNNQLQITSKKTIQSITISDVTGTQIHRTMGLNQQEFNWSKDGSTTSGIYVVSITNVNGRQSFKVYIP